MVPGQEGAVSGLILGELSLWDAGAPVSHLPCEVGTQGPFCFIDYTN